MPHWTRRGLLKAGLTVTAASALRPLARAADLPRSPRFRPFTRELPLPPVKAPLATPFTPGCAMPPLVDGQPTRYYEVRMRRGATEIIPGLETEIWGYDGLYPGPTIRGRVGEPAVVRFVNELDRELVVHRHGGHQAAASDGFPTDYVFPGERKDYCYPHVPAGGSVTEVPSTLWYHDHAKDVTGENVYRGLAGFYLVTDDLEDALVDDGVLPATAFDVPLVLQDRILRRDGQLHYDTFDFDGFLGDVHVANGRAQPFFRVQRRKYRFRILNGANARFYMLRLSNDQPFLHVGSDAWLFPLAIPRRRVLLGTAERAEVVIDFRDAPAELFLENVLEQDDGRGPDGDLAEPRVRARGTPLLKFVVEGPRVANDATVGPATALRPHATIDPRTVARTRKFVFERRRGAWVINGEYFDERRVDADPKLGSTERWLFVNQGGGWWHPIHPHHEAHQIRTINGRSPPPWNAYKKDTTLLGPNDTAEILIRFRDFSGPYVMHCHNIEHEDLHMMVRYDVVP
jgi:FtsP/CotA-like multicopper oxidase with cupredoxin domain